MNNSAIDINNTINGAVDLILQAGINIDLDSVAIIGWVIPLANLTLNSPTVLSGSTSITTIGVLDVNDTINGGFDLTLTAGTYIDLDGIIGGTTELTNVTLNSPTLLSSNISITTTALIDVNDTINGAFDLTLQAGSPALTGGGGGSQIGLYNNGFRYNMIGNPNGIPTLDVISYDGAIEKGSNINVTITAKAN